MTTAATSSSGATATAAATTETRQEEHQHHSGPPHYVDLHVNTGECVSLQLLDGQEQIIAGPATITMVSQQQNPPVPIPVQVPAGHMIHQIADENGTLKHIILSVMDSTASTDTTNEATQLNSTVIDLPHGSFRIGGNGELVSASDDNTTTTSSNTKASIISSSSQSPAIISGSNVNSIALSSQSPQEIIVSLSDESSITTTTSGADTSASSEHFANYDGCPNVVVSSSTYQVDPTVRSAENVGQVILDSTANSNSSHHATNKPTSASPTSTSTSITTTTTTTNTSTSNNKTQAKPQQTRNNHQESSEKSIKYLNHQYQNNGNINKESEQSDQSNTTTMQPLSNNNNTNINNNAHNVSSNSNHSTSTLSSSSASSASSKQELPLEEQSKQASSVAASGYLTPTVDIDDQTIPTTTTNSITLDANATAPPPLQSFQGQPQPPLPQMLTSVDGQMYGYPACGCCCCYCDPQSAEASAMNGGPMAPADIMMPPQDPMARGDRAPSSAPSGVLTPYSSAMMLGPGGMPPSMHSASPVQQPLVGQGTVMMDSSQVVPNHVMPPTSSGSHLGGKPPGKGGRGPSGGGGYKQGGRAHSGGQSAYGGYQSYNNIVAGGMATNQHHGGHHHLPPSYNHQAAGTYKSQVGGGPQYQQQASASSYAPLGGYGNHVPTTLAAVVSQGVSKQPLGYHNLHGTNHHSNHHNQQPHNSGHHSSHHHRGVDSENYAQQQHPKQQQQQQQQQRVGRDNHQHNSHLHQQQQQQHHYPVASYAAPNVGGNGYSNASGSNNMRPQQHNNESNKRQQQSINSDNSNKNSRHSSINSKLSANNIGNNSHLLSVQHHQQVAPTSTAPRGSVSPMRGAHNHNHNNHNNTRMKTNNLTTPTPPTHHTNQHHHSQASHHHNILRNHHHGGSHSHNLHQQNQIESGSSFHSSLASKNQMGPTAAGHYKSSHTNDQPSQEGLANTAPVINRQQHISYDNITHDDVAQGAWSDANRTQRLGGDKTHDNDHITHKGASEESRRESSESKQQVRQAYTRADSAVGEGKQNSPLSTEESRSSRGKQKRQQQAKQQDAKTKQKGSTSGTSSPVSAASKQGKLMMAESCKDQQSPATRDLDIAKQLQRKRRESSLGDSTDNLNSVGDSSSSRDLDSNSSPTLSSKSSTKLSTVTTATTSMSASTDKDLNCDQQTLNDSTTKEPSGESSGGNLAASSARSSRGSLSVQSSESPSRAAIKSSKPSTPARQNQPKTLSGGDDDEFAEEVLVVAQEPRQSSIGKTSVTLTMRNSFSENNIQSLDSGKTSAKFALDAKLSHDLTIKQNQTQGQSKQSSNKRRGSSAKSEQSQQLKPNAMSQVKLLNLHCTSATPSSVHLRWSWNTSMAERYGIQPPQLVKGHHQMLDHFIVESSNVKNNDDHSLASPKIVYRGCAMTCRINHLSADKIYHFKVRRTALVSLASSSGEQVAVSEVLSVTLPVAQQLVSSANNTNSSKQKHKSELSASSSSSSINQVVAKGQTSSSHNNHVNQHSNANNGNNHNNSHKSQATTIKLSVLMRQCRTRILATLGRLFQRSLSSCSDAKFAGFLLVLFTFLAMLLAVFIHVYIVAAPMME